MQLRIYGQRHRGLCQPQLLLPAQVRSASLSGDCHFKLELARGNWHFKGQHQQCVRRRAELSVAMNPNCGRLAAKAAANSAFERCFADTALFDRIPP